jgi:pyruvate/2-oxoglutarate dehydrogenase complex dihydrolipoamide acyltransferase (E2) component
MTTRRRLYEIVLPDLGLPGVAVTLSVWLVPPGAQVLAGDRVVEILAGDATVDLPAPASGKLISRRVEEDDPLRPGQILGLIDAAQAR